MAALSGIANCSKASERLLNGYERVDVQACSPQVRRQAMYQLAMPSLTQNSTTTSETTPVGTNCVIAAAYAVFTTAPVVAGGTATVAVLNSNGAVVCTGTDSILGKSNGAVFTLTLAGTNPALLTAGTDALQLSVVTSNNSVGTQQVGGIINIVVEPVEANPIID